METKELLKEADRQIQLLEKELAEIKTYREILKTIEEIKELLKIK